MRDPAKYKTMHVLTSAHADLAWISEHTNGKPMTEIVADLARAAREGLEERLGL